MMIQLLATPMEDTSRVLGSWFQPASALVKIAIWRVTPQMDDISVSFQMKRT